MDIGQPINRSEAIKIANETLRQAEEECLKERDVVDLGEGGLSS